MHKTWLIISREYSTRVRKKTFIIFTILSPLLIVIIGLLSVAIPLLNQKTEHILVKDDSGFVTSLPDSASVYLTFKYTALSLDALKQSYASLDDGYDALLYIPPVISDNPTGIELFSAEQISITTRTYIEQILADKFEEINLNKLHISKADILKTRPQITIDDSVLEGSEEIKGDALVASGLGYGMGFMIYIVLLIYGTMVMRGVMEEKTSRIVEVMISSVKPFQLMMGKIIGLGMVGLTQFSIWGILICIFQFIFSGIFASKISALQNASPVDNSSTIHILQSLQHLNIGLMLVLFIVFFIGGYLLYAALFAAVGSLSSDDDADIQMYTLPVTLPIIISVFILLSVIQQPHTQLAFWASIIPLSSPVIMPALIPFGVPTWQIILSVSLLIGGFIFTTYLASKIYRTGILMYGKKPKLKEILKWLYYKG